MTASTESDLRELKDLINARFNELDKKFEARFNELDNKINARFNELDKKIEVVDKKLDVYIAKTDEKLEAIKQSINKLDERVGRLEDTKEKQIWTLIMLLGGSLLTVALKFVLSGNNP